MKHHIDYCMGCEKFRMHICEVINDTPSEQNTQMCKRAGWKIFKVIHHPGRVGSANNADGTRWSEGNGRR